MEPLRPADPRTVGGYQVLARLGSGGMGTVFLGRSAGGRTVAVKVVHAALAGDPEFRARFAREVAAARAVSGAFTAPVIDADPIGPTPWLVTAYLPGYSLQRVVEGSGPLPAWSVATLGAGLAEALAGIHKAGVVHRDLKPSNVLLTPEGPRVIDFGVARAAEASAVTRTGATIGSPGYLSPEQATGAESGPAGDVFSLGAVLTYAATGHGPFGFGAPHDLLYRVVHQPPWLEGVTEPELGALITACLEKDPERRPTPEDVLKRLATASPAPPYGVGWLPPTVAAEITRPVPLPSPPRPGLGRRTLIFGGAGLAGAAVLAGGAAVLIDRANRPPEGTWTYKPPSGEATSGPVMAGGMLFVTEDIDGKNLVALDPKTGKPRWTARGVQPPTAGQELYVIAGSRVVYTNGPNSFQGIDRSNGSQLWYVMAELITMDPEPVVGGGLLFAGGRDSEEGLVAYDGVTGQRRWAFNTGESVNANPVAGGTTVYIGTSRGIVFAIETATGRARWRHTLDASGPLPPQVESAPILSGGILYVVTGGNLLFALDAATGEQKWKMTTLTTSGGAPSAVSVVGDVLYLADARGGLAALGARDGKLRWQHHFSGKSFSAPALLPVVSGNTAFCFDNDTLFALDTATGAERWHEGGLNATYERPAITPGAVHLASLSAIVSLDQVTGKVLRRRPTEMSEGLVAYGDVLYWRDSEAVYAAKAKT
ncbi:PQQ-binding-like beta-propeller repeat protein [Actinomadura sp. DC4]|uniref:outer membrane protein assembly factor BamB family protein n=1 Tax=Actinomadura sp. DC4 TaxID=3055069 RepID=UPI0025B1A618|nr:PQQ-binding-like beta-propeller repeat protein [Actinomadura sp. DC4]MDN3357928.1 PQQ-binding-like beta-propeller repeat protein [Actinomadura sp. DC4]